MRSASLLLLFAMLLSGCSAGPEYIYAPACPSGQTALPPTPVVTYSNPVFIPVADSHCAWETVVDVVDDYFRIEQEQPIRQYGDAPTMGCITTVAEISPTIFEPWRHDTVGREQRLENTFQTMRRRAVVQVTSEPGGHKVEVAVYKELENLARPEHSTAGVATFRYDSTLSGIENPPIDTDVVDGWIAKGRDVALEQYIIAHLLSRCGQTGGATVVCAQNQ